ncbi:MAG: PrsW family intramembrane metalloprotease [Candidatus Limimorpha sp.]
MDIFILALAILPVIVLLFYIYRQDKYEKEPLYMLVLAFLLGVLSIPLALFLDGFIDMVIGGTSVFYEAFFQAGIPEEFAKWLLFMLLIWKNRNFDEFFDGIVYMSFIGLGFACVENIMYVFGEQEFMSSLRVGVMRAVLSVPAHFLFAVIMGYFLGMAKFLKANRTKYLCFSLLFPIIAHGLFDYLLMLSSFVSEIGFNFIGFLLLAGFIWLDIKMWKVCLKNIKKMQENTRVERNNKIFWKIFKSK